MRSRYSWPTGTWVISSFEMPLVTAADVLSTSDASPVTVTDSVTPPTASEASAGVASASCTRTFFVAGAMPDSVNVTV